MQETDSGTDVNQINKSRHALGEFHHLYICHACFLFLLRTEAPKLPPNGVLRYSRKKIENALKEYFIIGTVESAFGLLTAKFHTLMKTHRNHDLAALQMFVLFSPLHWCVQP